jgi:hypothetical protein
MPLTVAFCHIDVKCFFRPKYRRTPRGSFLKIRKKLVGVNYGDSGDNFRNGSGTLPALLPQDRVGRKQPGEAPAVHV